MTLDRFPSGYGKHGSRKSVRCQEKIWPAEIKPQLKGGVEMVARKRSDQRIRRNKEPEDALAVRKAPAKTVAKLPRVKPGWETWTKNWFRSLKESGQSVFYEASDWQAAILLGDQIDAHLKLGKESGRPIRASSFEALWAAMGDLLTTEGQRRRIKVELQREDTNTDPDAVAVVSVMEHYRDLGLMGEAPE